MAQQTGAIYHQGILYSGGSGTNVTPNPQGEATDTLNTVEIDGTVYDIEGGGGGGSNLILDAQRYSLEEKVVGIWTDGKPLYQRTFEYSAGLNLNSSGVALPSVITSELTDVDKFIRAEGVRTTSGLTQAYIGMWVNSDRKVYVADPWSKVNIFTFWYTKSTDTAGSGGYQAYGFTPLVYSEEEREIGVWIDNKPLYQKTVVYSSGVNIGTSATTLSTANFPEYATIDKFISGFVNRETTNSKGTASTFLGVWKDGSNLKVYATTTWNGMTHFTFQYTKTTDVAGSGEYNTLAIPNVHYSTDEQVIGTWIDGKTLYQKTKIFPNTIAFSNDTVLDMEISNVDTIFVEEGYFYDFYGNAIGKLPYSQDGNLQYTISVKVDISNKSHLKISSNTTFGVNSDRYIAVTVRYTKTTD